MDVLAIKESIESFLFSACLMSLAGLFMLWACLKIRFFAKDIYKFAKRCGWPTVILFFICSAWATYTAFPTSEEKEEYRRQQNALDKAWGDAFLGNVANVQMLPITNTSSQSAYAEATSDKLGTANIGPGNNGNTGNIQHGNDSHSPFPVPHSLSSEDFKRGFVLTSIGTNEVHDFSPSENAIIDSDWRTFGAAEDWSYLAFHDWAFLLGTNEVERLRVCSLGEVDPIASFTNTYFAPFQSDLGIVPAANWHLLDEADRPSQFWHEITSLNTLKLTWQNVLEKRREWR